ncbi:hypothetical protein ACERII_15625 [Evansella sp. AB-rgal1]|uniref:hypothetical protein n=1 Tax=Evansella sp. AB-rgal1 TaxID=3242696 RepID=UPI00359EF038
MKNWKSIIGLAVVLLFTLSLDVQAFSWYDHKELKVTIETEDIIYEWEYENPDSFEYEEGNTIVRAEKAKESFDSVLTFIDLNKSIIDDDTIFNLEESGYDNIKNVVVKRVDRNEYKQSWIWTRDVE